MSRKLTRREVRARFHNIIQIGACDLDSLLDWGNLAGHLERAEGWAADVYYAGYVGGYGSVAICTGYAPIGNVKPDYALVHEYEMLGRQINDAIDYTVSGFTEKREALRRCLHDQFIQEVVYGIQQ